MKTRTNTATLDIGDMRNIVILKQPMITEVVRGNQVITFPESMWVNAYARVDPGGNERSLQEANLTYDNIITVYIYYLAVLKSNWKVNYAGVDYTIHQSSNVDSRNRFIKLLCYAKTG